MGSISHDGYFLMAGAGQMDITPQESVALTGYIFRENKSAGMLDPIYARAVYLHDGNEQILLFSCDLLGLNRDFVSRLREGIEAAVGLPGRNILLACTHTHSGPATLFLWECGGVESGYLEWLYDCLLELARQVFHQRIPVRVGVGKGHLASVSENRRPAGGPIDPDVTVFCLKKLSGEKLAVLVNFACHPTCLQYRNLLISGDYPGYAMRMIHRMTGAIPLFFNGACGNVRPIQRNSVEAVQATGVPLATVVLSILQDLKDVPSPWLFAAREDLYAPFMQLPSEEEVARARFDRSRPLFYVPHRTAAMDRKIERVVEGWRRSMLENLRQNRLPAGIPAEVQVLRIGPVAWVGIPGELFVELGLEIKQNSGLENIFLSCYTNDDIGYIPTREAYEQGGYEVEESYILHNYPAVLSPEVGEKIRDTAVRLIHTNNE